MKRKKFAALASTNASVINAVYINTLRQQFDLDLVIVDRVCGAVNFASLNQIQLEVFDAQNPNALDQILDKHNIDYLYLFYTRLIPSEVVQKYKGRIINFHPSLLPACPGLSGFEDTIKSGALIAGSTAHYIDEGMDTGPQIIQTYTSTKGVSTAELRHIIFAQQCASLFQIHKKLKMNIDPLQSSDYELSEGFCPGIDADAMLLFRKIMTLLKNKSAE